MTLDTGQLKARHGLGRRRLRVRLMATTDAWSRSRGRKRRAQALQRRQRHALGLGSHGGSAYGCVIIRPHAPRGKGDAGGAMLRSDPSWRQCADASGHQCISKKTTCCCAHLSWGLLRLLQLDSAVISCFHHWRYLVATQRGGCAKQVRSKGRAGAHWRGFSLKARFPVAKAERRPTCPSSCHHQPSPATTTTTGHHRPPPTSTLAFKLRGWPVGLVSRIRSRSTAPRPDCLP